MTAGHIGNGHAGLGRFGQDGQLLIQRIPTPALNAGQDFDSFRTVGHRRMTRRKPSPSLRSYVRFKWGPLQPPRLQQALRSKLAYLFVNRNTEGGRFGLIVSCRIHSAFDISPIDEGRGLSDNVRSTAVIHSRHTKCPYSWSVSISTTFPSTKRMLTRGWFPSPVRLEASSAIMDACANSIATPPAARLIATACYAPTAIVGSRSDGLSVPRRGMGAGANGISRWPRSSCSWRAQALRRRPRQRRCRAHDRSPLHAAR